MGEKYLLARMNRVPSLRKIDEMIRPGTLGIDFFFKEKITSAEMEM